VPLALVALVMEGGFETAGVFDAGFTATICIVQPLFADAVAAYVPAVLVDLSSMRFETSVERAENPDPALHAESARQNP
jgi:hypothetical protein